MQVAESGGNIREVHPMHPLGCHWTQQPHPYITAHAEDHDMKK